MSTVYTPVSVPLGNLQLPEDLIDHVTASSVNVPLAALADGIKCVGKYCTAEDIVSAYNAESGLLASTCEELGGTEALEFTTLAVPTTVKVGDRLVVDIQCHAVITGAQAIGSAQLIAKSTASGGGTVYPSVLDQAVTEIDNFKDSSGKHIPIRMCGVLDVTESTVVGGNQLKLSIYGKVSALGGVLRLNKPVWARMQVLRSI